MLGQGSSELDLVRNFMSATLVRNIKSGQQSIGQ